MSVSKVRKAFVTAAKARFDLLGFPVAWPNKTFVPPNGTPWLAFHWMPASKTTATLGEGGEDEQTGFIQLDVNTPRDAGEEATETALAALEAYFIAGRSVIFDSQAAVVSSCSRTPSRVVDPYWRASLTIYFYARIARPTLS